MGSKAAWRRETVRSREAEVARGALPGEHPRGGVLRDGDALSGVRALHDDQRERGPVPRPAFDPGGEDGLDVVEVVGAHRRRMRAQGRGGANRRKRREPRLGCVEPRLGCVEPRLGCVEPGLGCVEPGLGCVEPRLGCVEPGLGCAEPRLGCVEPRLGCVEPRLGCVEPRLGCVEPRLGCVEPGLGCAEPRLGCVEPRLGWGRTGSGGGGRVPVLPSAPP